MMSEVDSLDRAIQRITEAGSARFDHLARTLSPTDLYGLLSRLPKGGELHLHLSGCGRPEDWFTVAEGDPLSRVHIPSCDEHPANDRLALAKCLPACCRRTSTPFDQLSPDAQAQWLATLSIGDPHPARFFTTVVPALKWLRKNPDLIRGVLLACLERANADNVRYLEIQTGPFGYIDHEGRPLEPSRMADLYRETLSSAAARATGVHTQFIVNVKRDAPDATERLRASFRFAADNNDLWVGIHLSGPEHPDIDDLQPLHNLYWQLHQEHPQLGVAVHTGEGGPELLPRVLSALALPVSRVGHGLAAAHDSGFVAELTVRGITVESSITSNFMLGHVPSPSSHPVGRLFAAGVGVCLSTDNPGVTGTRLTDEFFCGVRHTGLRWHEVVHAVFTSITASFAPEPLKRHLLDQLVTDLLAFTDDLDSCALPSEPSRFAKRHLGV